MRVNFLRSLCNHFSVSDLPYISTRPYKDTLNRPRMVFVPHDFVHEIVSFSFSLVTMSRI